MHTMPVPGIAKISHIKICNNFTIDQKQVSDSPFRIQIDDKGSKFRQLSLSILCSFIERITGLRQLDLVYERAQNENLHLDFFSRVVSVLDIKIDYDPSLLEQIPATGPVIVVSNHPFGTIEALATGSMLLRRRPDLRTLGNYMLARMPAIRNYLVAVDPFDTESSKSSNIAPIRSCLKWLSSGGVLLTYPSGTVSHLQLRKMEVSDPPWSPTIARIARKSLATVIPVFVDGRNSALFQILGLIHPFLRTVRIPREGLRRYGETVKIEIGGPILPKKYLVIEDDDKLVSYFRMRTYLLGTRKKDNEKNDGLTCNISLTSLKGSERIPHAITSALNSIDNKTLYAEILQLSSKALLYENEEFAIYCSRSKFIPNVIQEIGRLREETFRDAGEGTGNLIDLDKFDNHYSHLFMWNKLKCEIVGAYRIGKTDRILRTYGIEGLYTYTLFKYKLKTMRNIGPALEMGRSFVRKEYQKNYSSLLLLWKGIGQYVVNNPRYKVLLGPVSISDKYNTASRLLMTLFLRANNFEETLEKQVKPRNPISNKKIPGLDCGVRSFAIKSLDDLSDLLREIEPSANTLPVLLRHYLKLGGKLMGFSVDPTFGNCLDGLIYVDLTKSDPKLLERYLGKAGSVSFLFYHKCLGLAHK